jgi:hypothetical protein
MRKKIEIAFSLFATTQYVRKRKEKGAIVHRIERERTVYVMLLKGKRKTST